MSFGGRSGPIDDQSLDLERYLGKNEQDNNRFNNQYHHKNLHKEQLYIQINRINSKLENICQERVGDITNGSPIEIQKTLQLVESLISEIRKYQDNRNKLIGERRQQQALSSQNQSIIEKLNKEKKVLEGEKESFMQKFKNLQKSYRQAMDKNLSQKDQLNKQIRQLQAREKTFQADFRKKETQIKNLQDGIKKFQDKPTFKNSFDIIQKFQYGPNIFDMCLTNGQNQYTRLAKQSKDEVIRKLTDQNQYLKQCLSNIYKELNIVLQLKRQTLRNKKGYDGQYENYFELNNFRPQTLNLPQQWSRQRLKQLNENIHKFKQAIKLGQYSESRAQNRKQTCVNGIKQIIKDYKQVVETQDQLLNKVLLKSKEFKASQMAQLENRFSKIMDSSEIQRAKRFTQQQCQYLESKSLQIQKTKKLMQSALKKAEQSKRQMLRQKQIFEEQALQMRRSLEVMPAIIEQELSKALN